MKVISTNLGQPKTIQWKGKSIQTGIYKKEVVAGIFLSKFGVIGDSVMNTKVHGGIDKSCYLFSTDHYEFWRKQYPNLDWEWGMFGENLSIKDLDETKIAIGDIIQIGEAIVEVSQPRLPCFKLGVKFKSQAVLKQYLNTTHTGAYVRVLKEGKVSKEDDIYLLEQQRDSLSLAQVYSIFGANKKDKSLIDKALTLDSLSESIKKDLVRFRKNAH